MNRLLLRQLRRLGLDPDGGGADPEQLQQLLERVSTSYDDSDRSRYLLERSLRISSQEMAELNQTIRAQSEADVARSNQRYTNLLTLSVIPTWQADFSAVGAALTALRDDGVKDLEGYLDKNPDEMERLAALVEIVAQNSTATELLDYSLSDNAIPLSARPVYCAVRDAVREQVLTIWDGRDSLRIEVHAGPSLATEFHGILHASIPRIDGVPDLSQVIVVVTDVTALKQAEANMERLVKSKDDFLASVSHEIRTPLTSVFGSAMVLADQWEGLPREDSQALVMDIATGSGEVADLVEDLLVAARADMGNIRIAPRVLAVRSEVEQVVAGLFDRPCEIDCSAVDGSVFADPLRFKQILRNLLTNAVRYGGKEIAVQSDQTEDVLRLLVCDDGNGIDADRVDTIFDLYEKERGKASLTTSVGVGLTVSRQLARLMGGDVVYEREEGWTRFCLDLPAASESMGRG